MHVLFICLLIKIKIYLSNQMKSENRFHVNGKVKEFIQILLMAVVIRINTTSIGTENINIYSAYIYIIIQ